MTKKIIIDTDPGIDDAMAILLALKSPELELVGLTTIFGNVHTDLATENALRLIELAGRADIPVAHGTDSPLIIPLAGVANQVHGRDGLGNKFLPPPQGKAVDKRAAEFIIETILNDPNQVTLVAIGPLTNLALALALEPAIADRVAEVVIMGGAALVNGNVTPAAEANIHKDPHAADIVFTAGWPLTMVGLDATEKGLMTDDYLISLKESGVGITEFIYEISRFYVAYHQQYELVGMYPHDPLAVAYAVDPTLFTTLRGPIRVVTEGIAAGQTLLDRRQRWRHATAWTDKPPTTVCVDVDFERFLSLFKNRMTASD